MIEQVYVTMLCTQCITSDKIPLKTWFNGSRYTSNNFVLVIIFWECKSQKLQYLETYYFVFTFVYLQYHLNAWFNVVWIHYIEQKIALSDLVNSWCLKCVQLVENFEIANWNFLREYILMDPNIISERLANFYFCITHYFVATVGYWSMVH